MFYYLKQLFNIRYLCMSKGRGCSMALKKRLPRNSTVQKIEWRAPTGLSNKENLGDPKICVSARLVDMLLHQLNLDESQIVGKKILSIANGLSDFVEWANRCGGLCYGVDPIYAYIRMTCEEFWRHVQCLGLYPLHGNTYEEEYSMIQGGKEQGIYFCGDAAELCFYSETIDMVVIANLLDNLVEEALILRIIREQLRVLKPDGEIRIPSVYFVYSNFLSGQALSLDCWGRSLMYAGSMMWFRIMEAIEGEGGVLYTVRDLRTRASRHEIIREHMREVNPEFANYQGLIIRKDMQPPAVTIYQSPYHDDDGIRLLRLALSRSPDHKRMQFDTVHADTKLLPERRKLCPR